MVDTGDKIEIERDDAFDQDEPELIIIPGKKPLAILYPLLFYIRRIIFAAGVIYLRPYITL